MKISTIITYYNGKKFLPDLLNSLAENIETAGINIQHFSIIIDDSNNQADHDSLTSIIKESRLEKFSKISLITNNKNIGVVQSRLKALRFCEKSDYFHIVDQDDLYEKNTYALLTTLNFKNDAIAFDGLKIDEYGNQISKKIYKHIFHKRIFHHINSITSYFGGGNQFITPGLVFFKGNCQQTLVNIYENFLTRNYDGIDDFYMFVMFIIRGKSIAFIGEKKFLYRIHSNNQRDRNTVYNKFLETYNDLLKKKKIAYSQDFYDRCALIDSILNKKFLYILKSPLTLLKYIFYNYC